jgi:Zn-dependent protease
MDSPPAATAAPVSADRLWAEQLAMGLALIVALLSFLAFTRPALLTAGVKVLGPDDLPAYGWAAAVGVVVQLIFHEVGTLLAARWLGLPLRFRFFPFGAHATAILRHQPRRVGTDAAIGFAGPLTGALVSAACALTYWFTGNSFFLGMSCVGCFYNLFTLIPLLDLEGGWIAPAITPFGWLAGLVLSVVELLSYSFNIVLFFVVCFALPRFVLLLRARAPRTDLQCTPAQRWTASILYFVLILALAHFASAMFENLPRIVRNGENMGD